MLVISDLAEAVGLSASPCLKRVRQLEKQGYIEGYGAKINISKLLNPTLVFTEFTLKKHEARHFNIFDLNSLINPQRATNSV